MKTSKSNVGAPAQHNQPRRKGKRAWRKNVNVEDVEDALEGMRAEERVTGSTLQKKADGELFQIDTTGNNQVRKFLPKTTPQFTFLKVLSQRSAVPAVTSRKRVRVSDEDKDRLRRIAKRPRKGPLNSIIDPTEPGAGSSMIGLSEAVKSSGTYDAWEEKPTEEIKDGLEIVHKKPVKPPLHKDPHQVIEIPAVLEPHQGTSYNPPADAHRELLLKAHETEEKRIKEAEKLAEVKAKMNLARDNPEDPLGLPPGMKLDTDAVDGDDDTLAIPRKAPERKTKQQRRKAANIFAEKRALAAKAAKKQMHSLVNDVKSINRQAEKAIKLREKAHLERRLGLEEKLKKKGLAGRKLGKHKVPMGEIDVQLGEDLTESLRALKPEGNLFRDRFLSLQHRALIEPRVRVLPTKRKRAIIEYEKHAWKNFQ